MRLFGRNEWGWLVSAMCASVASTGNVALAQYYDNFGAASPSSPFQAAPSSSVPTWNPVPQPAGPYSANPPQPASQSPPTQTQHPAHSPWDTLAEGRKLVRAGKPKEALPYIHSFIHQRSVEPEGYFWEGIAFDNLGRTSEALSAFELALQQVGKANMDSAELRMNEGNELLKLGRLDESIIQYQRALQVDASLAPAALNLGRAFLEKGEIPAALQYFQRCDDLHFQPYQLSYYRTKALLRAGRTDEARAQLQLCLAKIPPGDAAERIKREFSSLL